MDDTKFLIKLFFYGFNLVAFVSFSLLQKTINKFLPIREEKGPESEHFLMNEVLDKVKTGLKWETYELGLKKIIFVKILNVFFWR